MFDYRDMTIAIVGQGLAGSYMGYMLAKDRYKVLVFEDKNLFASSLPMMVLPKTYLSFLFFAVFQKEFDGKEITQLRWIAPNQKSYTFPLIEPLIVLDSQKVFSFLLHRSQEAGAKWIQEKVKDYFEDEGIRLQAGETVYETDFLIGADGKDSMLREKILHQKAPVLEKETHAMVSTILPCCSSQELLIRWLPDLPGFFWSFPTQKGLWIGLRELVPYHRTQVLKFLLFEMAEKYYKPSKDIYKPTISTLSIPEAKPFEFQNYMGPNWALVGKAAGLEDPIFGFSSSYSLLSAYHLCDSFAKLRPSQYPDHIQRILNQSILPACQIIPLLKRSDYLNFILQMAHRKSFYFDLIHNLFTGKTSFYEFKSKLKSCQFSLFCHYLFSWLG